MLNLSQLFYLYSTLNTEPSSANLTFYFIAFETRFLRIPLNFSKFYVVSGRFPRIALGF